MQNWSRNTCIIMEINVLCQLHACLYENAHEAFKLSNSSKLHIDYDTRTVDQLLNGNDGKRDFLPINKNGKVFADKFLSLFFYYF